MTPRRIGLLGGESTGKSSLALALADALPGFIAEEYLRDFVRDYGRVPTLADQEGIYLTQQMTVHTVTRAASHAQVPWVITDPLPLMTAVYSVAYFGDSALLAPGIADASTYDVVLWCAPDFPWESDDGQRDGPEYRDRVDQLIGEYVAPQLAVHRLTGSPPERLSQALDLIARTD